MPIEVRELLIKVTVTEKKKIMDQSRELQELKNKMVKECIEKVMTKLDALSQR